ncbi:Mitochondrial substrate carrier family protein [Hibiscus syriacus]|uniref:Mitochondrial substrate carrier family protein n=1 Tax=Hibiscus syriacus TaxID=106335 RepID=A0A6A2XEG8_HIBSY|nr:Mitochondrial substrate carrier family protein [Hibiscus syriacus]
MLSHIMGKCDEDEIHVSHQMEEVYQMLLKRLEHEKCKLLSKYRPDDAILGTKSATCVFGSEMMCSRSGLGSWMDIHPVVDSASCFLDMELLQELSLLTLVDSELLKQKGLVDLSSSLESGLKYSLTYSTRPPQYFEPHQKLLWLIDAWTSVDAVHAKVSSFVLEMWFWWHSLLWSQCAADVMIVPLTSVITFFASKLRRSTHDIKDFSMRCMKLKVSSCVLLQVPSPRTETRSFLFSTARSLFQQEETLGHVISLIASSSHQSLKSLIALHIEPLLKTLYFNCSSTESYLDLATAWIHIGGLRFHLLLQSDSLDPTRKYSWRLSHLEEKIASTKLEMKVRQECNHLAGWSSSEETDSRISQALEKLEIERRKLLRKIVYRPHPAKFKALRKECDEFLVLVNSSMCLVNNTEGMELQEIFDKACNWQETTSSFIDRLSNEYSEYYDVAQPIQVAVYEMKLGVSLVLSSVLQKKFLDKIQEGNMDRVLLVADLMFVAGSDFSFVRFPRGCPFELVSINDKRRLPMFSSFDMPCITNFSERELSLLEKLITISSDVDTEKGSVLQLKAALYNNVLVRTAHSVATAKLMDNASFRLLDKIFSGVASIWMCMKIQGKNQEELDGRSFTFRPRACRIENVMEVDISALGKLLSSDNFIEWQELLSDAESTEMARPLHSYTASFCCSCGDEWSLMEESILINMIHMHNQLFGSSDLVLTPGSLQITDVDRLHSFMGSYTLGVGMIKGFGGLFSSALDAKLVPEHLLRLWCEYEQKFPFAHKAACKYNFYKDSNTNIMAKMVDLLITLKHRVLTLLSEWEDHPGLQKVLDVIKMLLALPLCTPLAKVGEIVIALLYLHLMAEFILLLVKALSGLQFLLNRTRMLLENGSKFSLSEQLEPLISLVCSWQKMEFDSWPVLFDEVDDQYDVNAAKLWFPLYSVLHPKHSSDTAGHDQCRVCSLEEFIQTSSIGEFRKRLQLLFAFLGQIVSGRSLGIYSSPWQDENIKILYNIFGFYVQFLPIVMEFIETNRKKIETELKDLLKLCRWDRFESQSSFDNLKKPRQKIQKLIQKYSVSCIPLAVVEDMLQQPVMLILSEEVGQKGLKIVSMQSPKPNDTAESTRILNSVLNLAQFNDENRSMWYTNWGKKVNDTIQNLHLEKITTELHFVNSEGRVTMDCGDLWMDVNRNQRKKRALSELLKLLESSGLHRHKFEIMEISNPSSWLFLQPSYDAKHLLMERTRLPNGVADVSHVEKCLPKENLDAEWRTANEFYFKSLAAVQVLQQIRLKHHQDFTSEQQLFDNLQAMLVEESLLLKTVECARWNSCQNVKVVANRILGVVEEFIPILKKSKESLDNYFTSCDGSIITLGGVSHPFVISQQMEQLVLYNFQVLQKFEEKIFVFVEGGFEKNSIIKSVLSHFDEIFSKGKLIAEEFRVAFDKEDEHKNVHELADSCEKFPELEAQFGDAFNKTITHVMDVLQKLGSLGNPVSQPEALPSGSITAWESLFKSVNLRVDELCDKLLETIQFAENLVNHSGKKTSCLSLHCGTLLQCIHALLDLILSFSDSFLEDSLVMNKTVSVLTHGLANIFAALYAKGFGVSPKDQEDDTHDDMTKDASGTGMGEGAGVKDVSDQIEDEISCLGHLKSEEQDVSNDVPSKKEKGIEMEQDFAADTFSVSEDDSEEDNNEEDDEDQQLESAVGETGEKSEVVDEKLQGKDDDDNLNNNEKYESGPSVKDSDKSSREFRGKEDSSGAADEPDENKMDELEKETGETENQADLDENENIEDLNLNKEEAFADPTGLDLNEPFQNSSEDINMDEKEETDVVDENGEGEEEESVKDGTDEGNSNPVDETMEEMDSERNDGTTEKDEMVDATSDEKDDLGGDHKEDPNFNQMAAKKNISESEISDVNGDCVPDGGTATQANSEVLDVSNIAPEANWANSSDIYNDVAQRNLPSTNNSELNMMAANSSDSGKVGDHHPKSEFPHPDDAPFHRKQSNPYRNVGDALQEWKERVSISVDLQDDNKESREEIEDDNANEYGYVSEFEKGTAQALGPATADQVDADVNVNKPDENTVPRKEDGITDMEIDEKILMSILLGTLPQSLKIRSTTRLSINEEEMGQVQHLEEASGEVKSNASALWKRYELLTTRLSHELAEQLRLVMEPTIASKLQGDYKTGKRINMKKVIPYIASHYQKDKIWLRRTKPNKRDYQVIIAVDDSHSMLESGCSEVALKALVTVCRAMSQLEVGNLAVASFGKKGNIRLLQDFDQPFTGEAGVKMISSLTFKQENTITDEPVVDLLTFLNKKLDAAVTNARLPSGQNPLQQLVLIIGDGRLHEKENLKRRVRDVLSSKRMVAFLVLDSLQESIMDLKEVMTSQDKNNQFKISVSKYLDSFPFPYYVVLRNIEALPKTLADLLRQWFELMQNSRD